MNKPPKLMSKKDMQRQSLGSQRTYHTNQYNYSNDEGYNLHLDHQSTADSPLIHYSHQQMGNSSNMHLRPNQ